jgi:hypothetical protein
MSPRSVTSVRLLFADEGSFHAETIVDLLREEPSVTRQLHLDMKRLVSAYVVEDEAGSDAG